MKQLEAAAALLRMFPCSLYSIVDRNVLSRSNDPKYKDINNVERYFIEFSSLKKQKLLRPNADMNV